MGLLPGGPERRLGDGHKVLSRDQFEAQFVRTGHVQLHAARRVPALDHIVHHLPPIDIDGENSALRKALERIVAPFPVACLAHNEQ